MFIISWFKYSQSLFFLIYQNMVKQKAMRVLKQKRM